MVRIGGEVDNIADYYRAADLFVLPSRSEGLPNAVLEAMASGLLCVVADASGSRELIEDSRTGILFQVDDADSLRQSVIRANAAGAVDVGQAARNRVVRRFDLKQLAKDYESLYQHITS